MNIGEAATRVATDRNVLQKMMALALGLSPAFRKAFLLCDVHGFSVEEAAVILGINPAAVVIRLNRARRELNARLAPA